jgi:hypothetical protein
MEFLQRKSDGGGRFAVGKHGGLAREVWRVSAVDNIDNIDMIDSMA